MTLHGSLQTFGRAAEVPRASRPPSRSHLEQLVERHVSQHAGRRCLPRLRL